MLLVSVEDADSTPAPLCCVSPSAVLEPGLWMPRVPGADVQVADELLLLPNVPLSLTALLPS